MALLLIGLLSSLGWIPSVHELSDMLGRFFEKGGLPVIGMASFAENTIGLNVYFPGAIVILVAMALTAGDLPRALMTFLVILIPSMLAHLMNYGLGRWLGGRVNVEGHTSGGDPSRFAKGRMWGLFLASYWHPHLAAVTSYAAGTEGVGVGAFLRVFVVASLLWNSFWGIVMYNFGEVAGATRNLIPLFYVYVVGWLLLGIWRFFKQGAAPEVLLPADDHEIGSPGGAIHGPSGRSASN